MGFYKKSGGGVLIDGKPVPGAVNFESFGFSFISHSNLPFHLETGGAVVLNDEIHILGGKQSTSSHYKWNGETWVNVSTLPYSFYNGGCVVFNGEIHILTNGLNTTHHYKYNGSKWVTASTLPTNIAKAGARAVVFRDEIHVVYDTYHYKWNGSAWTSDVALPKSAIESAMVVYDNEIHVMGGSGTFSMHYAFNGTNWRNVSTLPGNFVYTSAVVDGGICLFCNTSSSLANYKWNGTAWTQLDNLPHNFQCGSPVIYNENIHLLGGTSPYYAYHKEQIKTYRKVVA